jgi:hypothetical protein
MNMPNKFVNNLTDENIIKLEQLWQTSSNFRLRNRSQAVLLSFQKVPIDETAKICNVGRDAVSSWIKRWETDGYEGLSDLRWSSFSGHKTLSAPYIFNF